MYTTVYLDGMPVLISPVEGQYGVSTNSDGKKEWTISIRAANGLLENNLGAIPYLHGHRTYLDVDGTSHGVTVSNDMDGDLSTVAAIEITLTEDGFDDASESEESSDIEITGVFDGYSFKGKLTDYSETAGLVGQFERAITGKIIPSPYARQYVTANLKIGNWNRMLPKIGGIHSFSFSYTDSDGTAVEKHARGRILSASLLNGNILSVELQEDLNGETGNFGGSQGGAGGAYDSGGGGGWDSENEWEDFV
jgi:hypothetical protein